jgi:hypothetical protein
MLIDYSLYFFGLIEAAAICDASLIALDKKRSRYDTDLHGLGKGKSTQADFCND